MTKSWAGEHAYAVCAYRFPEDIQQAVEYAAWLTQEEIHFR
jgi:hypothetical protein